jgi:APA family basic amino acid/polyamine antiporter
MLVNMGTLFAFAVVAAAVLIMRRTHPDAERPFRCPWVPAVPILGIVSCLLLMFSLPSENWLRLVVWLAIGLAIYFGWGRRHSRVGRLVDEMAGAGPDTLDGADRERRLQTRT